MPSKASAILIISTILGSWIAMQVVHEAGHVIGAVATGGTVAAVHLPPLDFSQTTVHPNPKPLIVTWAGPVVGVLVPVCLWWLAAMAKRPWAYLLRFFAGFCLVANGAYLGVGVFFEVGDCRDLLLHGATAWQLIFFGLIAVPSGFWLWHRQGKHFGLGCEPDPNHVMHGLAIALLTGTAWATEWVVWLNRST